MHADLKHSMKRIAGYIDMEDLVFDMTLLPVFWLLELITPAGGRLISVFNPLILVVIFTFMIFLAPWYLAGIYARYRERAGSSRGRTWLARLAFFTGFTSSFVICFGIPVIILSGDHEEIFDWFAFFLGIVGIIAVIMGWAFGTRYKEDAHDPEAASTGLFSYFTIVMAIVGPFGGFFLVVAGFMNDSAAYQVSGLAIGGAYLLISRQKVLFDKIFSSRLMRFYLFPFVLCFMMIFSHEIFYDLLVFGHKGGSDSDLFLSLVISGLLPVRLMLLLCPPVKIINFIIGAGAFGFFIYQFI